MSEKESQFITEEKLAALEFDQKKAEANLKYTENQKKERIDFIPEIKEISPKYLELWEKHGQYPVGDDVWDEVVNIAEKEEDTEIGRRGIYGDIPLESLLNLAVEVRLEPDSLKRYKFLTQKAPNGQIWFEVLVGLHLEDVESSFLVEKIKEKHWENGLDIGTGTGDIARKIEPYCDHIIGVDQAPFLLEIAREKKIGKEKFKVANVLNLPFKDDSFDLAVSGGLIWSFDRNQLEKYVSELSRVIKPGGSYFQGALRRPDEGLSIFELKSLANAKGILADLIVDKVSGRADMEDSIGYKDLFEVFRNNGFAIKKFESQDSKAVVFKFINQKR